MDIRVNDTLWRIQFKKPTSSELRRSDGTISLGVTDNTTKTVTIADNVSDCMTDKILCHELVHVYSFSYGCALDFGHNKKGYKISLLVTCDIFSGYVVTK